jgi:hypothetical protein
MNLLFDAGFVFIKDLKYGTFYYIKPIAYESKQAGK